MAQKIELWLRKEIRKVQLSVVLLTQYALSTGEKATYTRTPGEGALFFWRYSWLNTSL